MDEIDLSMGEMDLDIEPKKRFEYPVAFYFGYLLGEFPARVNWQSMSNAVDLITKVKDVIGPLNSKYGDMNIFSTWDIAQELPEKLRMYEGMLPGNSGLRQVHQARFSLGFQKRGTFQISLRGSGKDREDFESDYCMFLDAAKDTIRTVGVPQMIYPTGPTYGSAPEEVKKGLEPVLEGLGKRFVFRTSLCYLIEDQ